MIWLEKKHVELGKPIVRDIVDRHIRPHADRHLCGIDARHAATEDRDTRRCDTGHAAKQYAATALFLFEIMRTDLNRHATSDFAHRLEQRQAAARPGDGFIGDARRTRFHQPLGLRLVRREVEIGEQEVAWFEQRNLLRLRLFDLHDHLGSGEHRLCIGEDLRTRIDIILILEIDSHARLGLDHDVMTSSGEFGDRRRRQANAIFVILDFLGDTDAHQLLLYVRPS